MALCTFFCAQRHIHTPAVRGTLMIRHPGGLTPRPRRTLRPTSPNRTKQYSMNRDYSDWRAGISFQGTPGFRPHTAAANAVSTKSANAMACTLVQ